MRISCKKMTQFRVNIQRPFVSKGNHFDVALSSSGNKFRYILPVFAVFALIFWLSTWNWMLFVTFFFFFFEKFWCQNYMTRTRIWLMLWVSWGTLLPPYISPILVRFWHIVAYVLWLDLFINIWTWIVSHNTKYLVPLQVLWEKSHKMMLSTDTKKYRSTFVKMKIGQLFMVHY